MAAIDVTGTSHPTTPTAMRRNQSHMTERILNLTLEVIYLLTGEKYAAVKMVSIEGLLQGVYPPLSEEWRKAENPITAPSSTTQISEENDQKILEVTNKIIRLLSGEVPIHLSSDEREYLDGNRDLFLGDMMEDQPPLIAPGGSRTSNTPEKAPHDLYNYSTQEEHSDPHHHQNEEEIQLKVTIKEENDELYIVDDLQCKQEELAPEAGPGGSSISGTSDKPLLSPNSDENNSTSMLDSLGKYVVSSNIHPELSSVDASSSLFNVETSSLITPNSVIPKVQIIAASTDPSNVKESPDELHDLTPDFPPRLYRPQSCSKAKSTTSKKTGNNTSDMHPGLPSASKASDITISKASTSDSISQIVHSGNLVDYKPPDFTDLEALSPYKSQTISQNLHPGFYSADSSIGHCNPQGSMPTNPDVFNPTVHKELPNDYRPQDAFKLSSAKLDSDAKIGSAGLFKTYGPEEAPSGPVTQDRAWSGKEMYSCSDCWECFSSMADLAAHRRTHTRDHPGMGTNRKITFSQQPKKHMAKKIFRCVECGICFPSTTDLLKHRYRSHTKEKPFPCSECGKCYTQKSHLVNHQRIHTGENILPCPECGRRFTLRSQFIKHMRIHTGEKPFSCSQCGRCFAQKSTLDNHQSVHTGHKPFSCIECGKSFVRKATLQKHLETHTGVGRRAKQL